MLDHAHGLRRWFRISSFAALACFLFLVLRIRSVLESSQSPYADLVIPLYLDFALVFVLLLVYPRVRILLYILSAPKCAALFADAIFWWKSAAESMDAASLILPLGWALAQAAFGFAYGLLLFFMLMVLEPLEARPQRTLKGNGDHFPAYWNRKLDFWLTFGFVAIWLAVAMAKWLGV